MKNAPSGNFLYTLIVSQYTAIGDPAVCTCVIGCVSVATLWAVTAGGIRSRDRSSAVHATSNVRQVPEIHDRRREQCRHLAARRRTHAERSTPSSVVVCLYY